MQNIKKNAIFFYSDKVPNYMDNITRAVYFHPPLEYQDEVYVQANPYIPMNIMPGRYLVSNYGKVWDTYMNQFAPVQIVRGYTMVSVTCYKNDNTIYYAKMGMHRMVMAAFKYFPGCENMEVNHLDTTLYNGALCNWLCKLEWCTRKENMEYASSLGHMTHLAEEAPNSKFTNDQVREMCEMFEQGKGVTEVAKKFNANTGTVQSIKNGKNYSSISKDYNLPEKRRLINQDTVIAICNEINNGKTNVAIAAEFGVSADIVSDIRCGNTWTDITAGRIEYSKFYKTNSEIHEVCRLLEEGKSLTQIMKISGMSKNTIIGIKKGRIHKEISSQYDIPVYTQVNTPEEVVHEICKRLEQKEAQCDIAKDLIKRGKITNKNIVNDISRGHKFKNISCQYKI